MNKKVIACIMGGLGNQLFSFCAARRLALLNGAELVLDNVSSFLRDRRYGRTYMLDRFSISARFATPSERLEPLARCRRAILKRLSRRKPFKERRYLEQDRHDFDERLLTYKVNSTAYLEGYWQSERYFKDIEQTIRQDLKIPPPKDVLNLGMAENIKCRKSVAVHLRWFDPYGRPTSSSGGANLSTDYYKSALAFIESNFQSVHYFVFSDDPDAARSVLPLPRGRAVFVSLNRGDSNAHWDLWLMAQCRHFVTANSTFSWWGAWLGEAPDKIVLTPAFRTDENIPGVMAWGFEGLIPHQWIKI